MKKEDVLSFLWSSFKTMVGCAMFAIGFNMFLEPANLNAGGVAGLAMVFGHLFEFSATGLITGLINIPLFMIAGFRIGKRFFAGSLIGSIFISLFIDILAFLPKLQLDPLIGALYGGVIAGIGLGLVFAAGMSTGGSDIVVRLLKKKWAYMPIGIITIMFDAVVAVLTGIAYQDITRALYSGITIFITGQVIDAVVYRFDYSKVAWIVTKKYDEVANMIGSRLRRGVTLLKGEGAYSHRETKVILTAVKKQQIAELKEYVVEIDPDAFIIVQEAHQVLGDGFRRYSKDQL